MTDEQIIKALECSPLIDIGGCRKIDALSLINRQKAEIERLKELNDVLETDNINANMNLEHIQYEVDLLKQEKSAVIAEAIKEFAEKLKEKSRMPLGTLYGKLVYLTDIDNLVKEMTEETPS